MIRRRGLALVVDSEIVIVEEEFPMRWFAEWAQEPPMFGPATERLVGLIEHDPQQAWAHILRLIERAPSEPLLNCVGAGPLEDLLCAHGDVFIDQVEQLAARDDRFRQCLAYVWGQTRMDADIHRRVRCAAMR